MTKEQVHEAFCKGSDEEKMRLAVMCQMKGVDISVLEETMANVLTGVQKNIGTAMDYYRYLNGGCENGTNRL